MVRWTGLGSSDCKLSGRKSRASRSFVGLSGKSPTGLAPMLHRNGWVFSPSKDVSILRNETEQFLSETSH